MSADPWMFSAVSSAGEDVKKDNFVPNSANDIIEKMACRIGRAFRLTNADLYRVDCTEFNSEIADLAIILGKLGRKIRPHLGKSQEASHLLDLLAMLAISRHGDGAADAATQATDKNMDKQRMSAQEDALLPAKVPSQGKGKDHGETWGCMQGKGIFVPPPLVQTVEKIVEKIIEVPQI